MDIEAILFDIDGTLVDSNEQHVMGWAFAFREEGCPQELDDIRAQIGKGGDLLVPALLPAVGEPVRKRIAAAHGRYFKSVYLDEIRSFPNATDLIEKVHAAGRKIVLATSAKRSELEHYVELLGVRDYLSATTSIDDVESSKPEPDIFGASLEKIGVQPERALVIGDTIYDVQAARAAGIATLAVASGPFDHDQLKEAGAIAVFADVGELLRDFDNSPLAG